MDNTSIYAATIDAIWSSVAAENDDKFSLDFKLDTDFNFSTSLDTDLNLDLNDNNEDIVTTTSFEDNVPYIVYKGYTAKQKDEISLPLGTEVYILEEKDERKYVAALNNAGQEFDRGWVPSFCLLLKEDATDTTSIDAKPPTFLKPLENGTAVEGESTELMVHVNGFPKPEITWFLDGLPVRNDLHHRVIEDDDVNVLHISAVGVDDEGVYTVKANNTIGAAQCQAELLVESDESDMSGSSDLEWEDPTIPLENFKNNSKMDITDGTKSLPRPKKKKGPSFTRTLTDTVADEGDSVSFYVEINSDENATVSWYIKDDEVKTDNRIFICGVGLVHTMTITEVADTDSGIIKCFVSNGYGSLESTCSLRVQKKVIENNVSNSNPYVYCAEESISIEEDADAELQVEYGGDPQPDITWHKDHIHLTSDYGVIIETGTKKSKLVIPEVTKDDNGTYYCIAENQHGEEKATITLCVTNKNQPSNNEIESDENLTSEGPPNIVDRLRDKTISEGDPILLQIKASGNPKPSIQWYQDSNILKEGVNCKFEHWNHVYRLFIPLCELNNSGEYSCVVENEFGSKSCAANITVEESIFPPKFFQHTNDLLVQMGESSKLDAIIKAKPAPIVEWYKDNRQIFEKNGFRFLGNENRYSLFIPEVTSKHAGTYKCIAFNNAGESACIIRVKVGDTLPKFTERLDDLNIFAGQTLVLSVTINSQTEFTTSWFKNSEPITNFDNFIIEEDENRIKLIKEDVTEDDNGLYSCEAVNTSGKNSSRCSVSVGASGSLPSFTQGLPPNMRSLEHEKGITFEVSVAGDPLPEVLFYKDGAVIESTPRRMIIHEENTYRLHLKYALFDDAGEYLAVASNCNGETETTSIFEVLPHNTCPEFLKYEKQLVVNEGEECVLSATVKGNPRPKLQWLKDKQVIATDDDGYVIKEQGGICSLKICSASSADSGEWKCIATNTAGTSDISISVRINEKKKMFAPEFLSSLRDNDVLLGETAYFQVALIGYPEPRVVWKRDGCLIRECDNIVFNQNKGVFSMAIKKTEKDDRGVYEAYAKNIIGETICQSLLNIIDTSLTKVEQKESGKTSTDHKSNSPKFLKSLHDITVEEGGTITLETTVGGDPLPLVKWFKQDKQLNNGKRVTITTDNDGKNTLEITDAELLDCGDYECLAGNTHGESSVYCEIFVKEIPKNLKIENPEKPVISGAPEEAQTFTEGDEIKFSFKVSGVPAPKFEILKNDKVFKPAHGVIRYEKNIFSFCIAESKTQDDAVYEIIATNSEGKDSCKVEILVEPTEELELVTKINEARLSSDGQNQSRGGSSTSSDEGDGSTSKKGSYTKRPYSKPKTKKTKKNSLTNEDVDDVFEDSQKSHDSISPISDEKLSTTINQKFINEDLVVVASEQTVEAEPEYFSDGVSVDIVDGHEEEIKVQSVIMTETTPNEITLDENITMSAKMDGVAPVFTERLKETSTHMGQSVTLSCTYKNILPENVLWRKNGDVLYNETGYITIEKSPSASSVVFENARILDSGEYTCEIQNNNGNTATCSAVLIVIPEIKLDWIEKCNDVSVTEGETIVLTVEVEGMPMPEVQFYVKGKQIQNSERMRVTSDVENGTHRLSINKSTLRDSEVYTCVAENDQGKIECSANVQVNEIMLAPEFINKLRDCEVAENEMLCLKVDCSGKPQPMVEWYFNGDLVKPSARVKIGTEGKTNILRINEALVADSGVYKAVCFNDAGEIETSCSVNVLEELRPPRFLSNPPDVSAKEGKNATFEIRYTGKPEPKPTWSCNGNVIDSNPDFRIETNAGISTLSIEGVDANHAGDYCCEISNKHSSEKCVMKLMVEEKQSKPVIYQNLHDVTIQDGETVTFSVELSGSPKPDIIWYKDGKEMKASERIMFTEENTLSMLIMFSCSPSDSGQYEVVAKNKAGEVSSQAKLKVEALSSKPTFQTGLQDISCSDGDDIELAVVAKGVPTPELKWFHNDSLVKTDRNTSITQEEEFNVLKMRNCGINQSGEFKCIAQNKVGVIETSCFVQIMESLSAPVFEEKPTPEMELLENEEFSFEFVVKGKPEPSISITKDGKKIDPAIASFKVDQGHGLLTIPHVAKVDEGMYKIKAENSEGSVSCSVALVVPDTLKFITSLEDTTVIEGNEARLEVEFLGNVLDADWYKDNEYIDESEKYAIIDEQTKCICIIRNCKPSDTGIYRCEILNEKSSVFCTANLSVTPSETKPSFDKTFRDVIAEEGDAVTLTIIANGSPTPSCKWFKDGKLLSSNGDLLIASDDNTHMLMFSSILPINSGKYRCELSNKHGKSVTEANVAISGSSQKPKFKRTLESKMEVTAGNEFKATVFAEGSPSPKINFLKDGENITYDKRIFSREGNRDGEASLIIKRASFDDEGEYSASATNGAGTVTCTGVLFVQKETILPKFISKPHDMIVYENCDATFNMKVSGIPEPTVNVYFNNELVTTGVIEDEECEVVVTECGPNRAGKYTFEASNDAGKTTVQANLTVQESIKSAMFEKKMEVEYSGEEGKELCLKSTISGHPIPLVTFFKDNINVTRDSRFEISIHDTEVICVIKECCLEDSGVYTCRIENSTGEDTCTAHVRITPPNTPPKFLTEFVDIEIEENEDLSFEIEVEGYPIPNLKCVLGEKMVEQKCIVLNDKQRAMFTKSQMCLTDTGIYTIIAKNDFGECKQGFNVTVLPQKKCPEFLKPLENINALEGDKLILEIHVESNPTPEITWYKDDVILNEENGFTFKTKANGSKFNLLHDKLTAEYNGVYRALLFNDLGEISCECKVTVGERPEAPKFVQKLDNLKADEETDVCFHAILSGKPFPDVTWFKDRFEVKNKGRTEIIDSEMHAYLDLKNASVKDNGRYKCVAKNSTGEVFTSASLKVTEVIHPPSFTSELEDMSVAEGQPLLINIECAGTQPMKVKWTKNGKSIFKSPSTRIDKTKTGHTLKLNKVTKNDEGVYALELQNSAGTNSISCNVSITEAPVAPMFTIKPRDVTTEAGKDIDITVKATGKPAPVISWFLNDEELTEERTGVTKTEKRDGAMCLGIKSISTEFNGVLRCDAANATGQITTSCKINVNEQISDKLEFDTTLSDTMDISQGVELKLTAVVAAKPEPTVTWFKNQRILKDSARVKLTCEEKSGGLLEYNLTIAKTDLDDAGTYKLSLRNKSGSKSSTCKVNVSEIASKPVFSKELKEVDAKPGDVIRMPVEVKSNRKTTISWEKDGSKIKAGGRIKIEERNNASTLVISSADESNNGLYACVAENEAGSTTTECEIFVSNGTNKLPKFESKMSDFTVNDGDDIKLTVLVSGEPKPQVNFYKENKRIQNIDGITISDKNGEWSVIIEDATPEDSGIYECKALNEYGEAVCSCYVTVNESETEGLHVQCVEGNDFVTSQIGSDVMFEAEIFGSPEMVDWSFGDTFLDSDEKYQINIEEGHSTLSIFNIDEEDAGNYACVVALDDEEVEQMFTLKVEQRSARKFFDTRASRNKSLETRTTTVEPMKKTPKPVPEKKVDSLIKKTTNNRPGSVETNSSPDLDEDERSVKGRKLQSDKSIKDRFNKTKGTAPAFSMEPKSKQAELGNVAKFTCNCTAIPDCAITWYYQGKPVRASQRFELKDTYGFASFTIKNVTRSDYGTYKVVAENNLGTCEAEFTLSEGSENSRETNGVSPVDNRKGVAALKSKMSDQSGDSEDGRDNKSFGKTKIQGYKPLNQLKKTVDAPPQAGKKSPIEFPLKKVNKDLKDAKQVPKRNEVPPKTEAPPASKKTVPPPTAAKKTNDAGDVSFVRELPGELVVRKGKQLHLEVELTNNDGEVFWERDGEQLDDCKNVRFGNRDNIHYLEIDDMQSDDEGDFEVFIEFGDNEISCMCEVYIDDDAVTPNTVKTTSSPSSVNANETSSKSTSPTTPTPKKIEKTISRSSSGENGLFAVEEKLKPTVVESGEETTFLVVLTRPADNFEWLINNKIISSSNNKYNIDANEDHYTLKIRNCDLFLDKKVIQFIGYSGDKEVTSQTKLTVLPASPMLIERCDLAQEGLIGDNVLLSVEVKGFNNPLIQWMKGFKVLTNNPLRNEISFQDRIATLGLKNIGTYDSGIYKCIVSENGKKHEKKFNVKIKAKKV